MKTLKFDNYTVICKIIETSSNYDLSVQVFKDKEKMPIGGTITKRGTKDIDILKFAFQTVENKVEIFN